MSLFRRDYAGASAAELIPTRGGVKQGSVVVNNDTALRHSAVWACLRLRADLLSTMPIDCYRSVQGTRVEVPIPKVLVTPGGERVGIHEWMYATQFDLDRAGNAFGLITERDGNRLPSRIDLVALSDMTVKMRDGAVIKYRIGRTEYDPSEVWHEKQFPVGGFGLGLSAVAYSAWSIGEYLSIQEFALDWFGNSTVPSTHLKKTDKTMTAAEAQTHKERFQASVHSGQPWVTGMDWEASPLTMVNESMEWVEGKQFGVTDIARFFGVPGDLIDAAASKSSITYANITQRNLQFLIMNLGPAVIRREAALSSLTLKPRYVKLNTDALLRMDPAAAKATIAAQVAARLLTNAEGRALDDRPPLTPGQIAEFETIYGPAGGPTPAPTEPTPAPTQPN